MAGKGRRREREYTRAKGERDNNFEKFEL